MSSFNRYILKVTLYLPLWFLMSLAAFRGGQEIDHAGVTAVGACGLVFGVVGGLSVLYRVYQRNNDPAASRKWLKEAERVNPANIASMDIGTFRLIRRNPRAFIWPLVAAPLAPFAGLYLGAIVTGVTIGLFDALAQYRDWGLLLIPFFAVCTFFGGFILAGEVLQRQVTHVKRSILKEIVLDYWKALPLLILMTIVLVILLLFVRDREKPSLSQRATAATGLTVLKYYIYLNLAAIVFSGPGYKVSYRESAQFMVREKAALFRIWVGAGLTAALVGIVLTSLMILHVLSIDLGVKLIMVTSVIYLYLQAVSEQIQVLIHYAKYRHPRASKAILR